jgi:hypothetical protein
MRQDRHELFVTRDPSQWLTRAGHRRKRERSHCPCAPTSRAPPTERWGAIMQPVEAAVRALSMAFALLCTGIQFM